MSKLPTTEALNLGVVPGNGIPGSDQGLVDFPALVFGHLVVRRSGASRIPCGGPARTSVVRWAQWLVQELSYLSMGDLFVCNCSHIASVHGCPQMPTCS